MAFQNYTNKRVLYETGDLSAPNTNCLSILRLFFCGIQFPQCDSLTGNAIGGSDPSVATMCDFICNVYVNRCPEVSFLKRT